MLDTYKQFRRFTTVTYIEKSNEELAQIYKNALNEYEKSQSVGAIFIKNFPAFLRVTSKYNYIDSSEKAGLITMELLNTLNEYDSTKTKFITYLITRIENLFLWNYTNNRNKIEQQLNSISLDAPQNTCDEDDEYKLQIEDKYESEKISNLELRLNIERIFDRELFKYKSNISELNALKLKVEFYKKIIGILLEDPKQSADQIARKLGLYRKKEEYFESTRYPDVEIVQVKDSLGRPVYDKFGRPVVKDVVTTRVRTSQYEKVQEALRDIRRIFKENKCYLLS